MRKIEGNPKDYIKRIEERSFQIRDLRKKKWFVIDDDYLNGYAKIFGPNGTAVYVSLCRRTNKDQYCWPSEKLIGKDHGITDRTVRKYIKLLEEANIIRIKRKRHKTGRWYNNVYYLLDKSVWAKPEEINSFGTQRNIKTIPTGNIEQTQRKQLPTKDTQEKDTHKKVILNQPNDGDDDKERGIKGLRKHCEEIGVFPVKIVR